MTHDSPGSGTPRPSRRRPVAATALVLALAAACSPGATSAPTAGPSGGPSAGPTGPAPTPTAAPQGAISHPSGATDIVFRVDTSGGFVPVEFMATSAPGFTLYGDGTVVFRDPFATAPDPVGNVVRGVPFQMIKLGEEGIQAILADALERGALGVATGPYQGLGADIPTTTFTINANGATKEVSVVGLSPDMHPQNVMIVTAISQFAERLNKFGDNVAGEQVYTPQGYRGILIPQEQPFGAQMEWPWPDLTPADFQGDQNDFLFTRAMTLDEVAALGIPNISGGLQGISFNTDGKFYSFALRPLLPDETS